MHLWQVITWNMWCSTWCEGEKSDDISGWLVTRSFYTRSSAFGLLGFWRQWQRQGQRQWGGQRTHTDIVNALCNWIPTKYDEECDRLRHKPWRLDLYVTTYPCTAAGQAQHHCVDNEQSQVLLCSHPLNRWNSSWYLQYLQWLPGVHSPP